MALFLAVLLITASLPYAAFAAAAAEETAERDRFFKRSGIDSVPVATDRPYIQEIRSLFRRRARGR